MKYLIYFLLIFISIKAFAHQPKLIKHSPSMKNPYEVIYPEISKAYYGKLNRKSHYYRIISNKDFLFYAGILTPKVNENHKWISLDIIDENNNIIYQADGLNLTGNLGTNRMQETGIGRAQKLAEK